MAYRSAAVPEGRSRVIESALEYVVSSERTDERTDRLNDLRVRRRVDRTRGVFFFAGYRGLAVFVPIPRYTFGSGMLFFLITHRFFVRHLLLYLVLNSATV